jgi:hypothetical protein
MAVSAADEILNNIRSIGGRIEATTGGLLHLDVPAGTLTPQLKARIKQHKGEILRRLELESRLSALGISIAIDKATSAALLIFSHSDAEAVRELATLYEPFSIDLTPAQRRELTKDLDYYERLLKRKGDVL